MSHGLPFSADVRRHALEVDIQQHRPDAGRKFEALQRPGDDPFLIGEAGVDVFSKRPGPSRPAEA